MSSTVIPVGQPVRRPGDQGTRGFTICSKDEIHDGTKVGESGARFRDGEGSVDFFGLRTAPNLVLVPESTREDGMQ